MSKTILITGAASGIGEAAVRLFSDKGWKIIGIDVSEEGLKKVKERCAEAFVCDVSEKKEVEAVAENLKSQGIVLDALFNCAGILRMGLFYQLDVDSQLKIVDVNLKGIVNCTYLFFPLMKENSAIVNMSSLSSLYGTPELAVYSATKSAVKTLTEALNIEFEPKGIYVCDIIVDYVKTPMVLDAEYKATSVRRLGVTVSPEKVAKKVFSAVNSGRRVHHYVGIKAKLITFSAKLFPFASKLFAKILAFKKR